jgi:adenylate cyclase
VSLLDVLEGRVESAQVRNRIVMVGYTTPQSKDDFYTPFSSARSDRQKMPGVVIHAQSASQLLSTVLDGKPLLWVWPLPAELVWIVAWSFFGGVLGWYLRHPGAFALVAIVGAAGLYGISLAIFFQGGWIPVVPAALTFLGTAVGVVLLDRFNNSAYGQQVYRKVKTLLHLDIEIAEDKLEKQVAEITESDYFRDLQDKVKSLRDTDSADDGSLGQAIAGGSGVGGQGPTANDDDVHLDALKQLLAPEQSSPKPALASPTSAPGGSEFEEFDFFTDISRDAQQFKRQVQKVAAPAQPDDDGLDFLKDLNRDAQQLKQTLKGEAPCSSPLTLDDAFCRCGDTSPATILYINFIEQEIKKLKQSIGDQNAQPGRIG